MSGRWFVGEHGPEIVSATSCRTCRGAHWVATGPDIADRDDCPECRRDYPQACSDCGRSSEVTDPDPDHDGRWLCTRCRLDRAREVAQSLQED